MAAKAQFTREYKLVVIGLEGVGKSSLVIQFVQNHFVDVYDPVIEDSFRKLYAIDDELALLDILDTATQEDYFAGITKYLHHHGVEGFLLVYSIIERASFNVLGTFPEEILRAKNQDYFPIMIVGNKCDLEDRRQVDVDEGRDFAKRSGCSFIETSAKERINVDEAFINLVREIRKHDKTALADYEGDASKARDPHDNAPGCRIGCVAL